MMTNKKITIYFICFCFLIVFINCSRKIPNSYGHITKEYSCIAILPLRNDTSFSPMDELLTGYMNIDMYRKGLQEVLGSKDLTKIFKEEGRVYFPKKFNKPLAIEYSTLLGLDGVFFGTISSPNQSGSDVTGKRKLLDLEIYFLDVKSSNVVWSYTERGFITPGDYNNDLRKYSRNIIRSLFSSGFKFTDVKMPCWDYTLADFLRRLPDLSREMFNSLSYDISESDDANIWLNMGNIFMLIGKRNLALAQYQRYLRLNPTSPFREEVENQVAVLKKTKP